MIVRVDSLRQEFGETVALDDVNFSFKAGEVHGFIGPNGSGKTTTMRILSGLLEPTSGDAFYDDVSRGISRKKDSLPSGNHPVSDSGIPLPQVVPQTLE